MEDKDLKYYAKVHSVESFGTVDGPGIRFVLFLQGCHLQCKYCHNRDTWDINSGNYMSLDNIFDKIIRCKNYITPRGGVTITGGEPLLQAKFIAELFEKLKKEGIHTCIDTSGMVALTEDVKRALNLTDLVLLDVKHIDDKKCKDLVGLSNKLELNFARYLSDNNIPIWIRQVIVSIDNVAVECLYVCCLFSFVINVFTTSIAIWSTCSSSFPNLGKSPSTS